jgi:hypothetical protein
MAGVSASVPAGASATSSPLPQVFGAVQGHGGSTTPIRVGVREKRVHL